MSYWRDFGYKGECDTCIWCGYKLIRRARVQPAEQVFFCGMRCGYMFACHLAREGTRAS